jgi:hypothetical protein
LSGWNSFFLPNRIREFQFRFLNNSLGLNSRVTHFVQDINESCTFCEIEGMFPAPRETFAHIFLECPVTGKYLDKFFNKFFPNKIVGNHARKLFTFTGTLILREGEYCSLFGNTVSIIICYLIWECRLQKQIKAYAQLESDFLHILEMIDKTTKRVRSSCMVLIPKLGLNLEWAIG